MNPVTTTDGDRATEQETEQRRQRVLEAALAAFLAHGFPESSVPDIIEASGVDPEAARALFPRKHDLFEALCQINNVAGGAMMSGLAQESPAPPTGEVIVRVMEFWESLADGGGRAALVPQALGLSLFDAEINGVMQEVIGVQRQRWTALAESLHQEGRLREGADVAAVAVTLHTMSMGFMLHHMLGGIDSGTARRGLLDLFADR